MTWDAAGNLYRTAGGQPTRTRPRSGPARIWTRCPTAARSTARWACSRRSRRSPLRLRSATPLDPVRRRLPRRGGLAVRPRVLRQPGGLRPLAERRSGVTDVDGMSVREALAALGLAGPPATGSAGRHFVEVHIEQGPVLERAGHRARGRQLDRRHGRLHGRDQRRDGPRRDDPDGRAARRLRRRRRARAWPARRRARRSPARSSRSATLRIADPAANVVPGRVGLTVDVRAPASATLAARCRLPSATAATAERAPAATSELDQRGTAIRCAVRAHPRGDPRRRAAAGHRRRRAAVGRGPRRRRPGRGRRRGRHAVRAQPERRRQPPSRRAHRSRPTSSVRSPC